MKFKITHIRPDGTLAKVQNVEAGSLYAAYKVYLVEHEDVKIDDLVNAADENAVNTAVKEGKKMTKTADKTTKKANTKSTKKAEAKPEVKKAPAKKAQPKAKAPEGVKATYELNEAHNGIEIKFTAKPSAEVRAQLKALKFRWHQTKGLWYAKQSAETLALAKALCEAEKPAKKQAKKAQPKAEPVVEVKAEESKTKKPSRKGIESYKAKDGERICKRLIEALNRTEGIKAEVIVKNEGQDGWLWVTGEGTKEHKDKLKELGFFWSGKKQAWYLSPAPLKRNYKTQFGSMDALRGAAIA